MSGGAKRNADKVNTIGVVVIGICAAVLVYVSIVGLQAFYSNDSSDVQTMADYGGQDTIAKTLRADQSRNINETKNNGGATFSIPIATAMKLVVDAAKPPPPVPGQPVQATGDMSRLVPAIGPSVVPTIQPLFGRPKPLAGSGSAGSGSAPVMGSGPGSGSGMAMGSAGSGSGSAAPTGSNTGSNGR